MDQHESKLEDQLDECTRDFALLQTAADAMIRDGRTIPTVISRLLSIAAALAVAPGAPNVCRWHFVEEAETTYCRVLQVVEGTGAAADGN